MATNQPDPLSPDVIAAALNEQGFLFQRRVYETLQERDPKSGKYATSWYVHAVEYPVSTADGQETRVDLVLDRPQSERRDWYLAVECKRSHPDFKTWVFFDEHARSVVGGGNHYYLEQFEPGGSWQNSEPIPYMHLVARHPISPECPLFGYYLESRLERPGSGKAVSATKAIEDAFHQVTLGQAGVLRRLRDLKTQRARIAPIVVTTATVAAASFDSQKVSADKGTIDAPELKIEVRDWLAVNYRISDVLLRHSQLTTNISGGLRQDLEARQVRTVFVVTASRLNQFLNWFQQNVVDY